MRVLMVDDDDLVRTVAVDTLEHAGFEVIEAATAERLWTAVANGQQTFSSPTSCFPGASMDGTLPSNAAKLIRTFP
jgi:DNA-binding response OmpR family regulator